MIRNKLAKNCMKNTILQLDVSITPDILLSKKTMVDTTEWKSAKIASCSRQTSRKDPLMRSQSDYRRIFKRT